MGLPNDKRRQIMKEELKKLKENKSISTDTYESILQAYEAYYIESTSKPVAEVAKPSVPKPIKAVKDKGLLKETENKKAKKILTSQEIRDRNIKWALNLGVILLLIGGLVLATSAWDMLGNWMRTSMIGFVSLLSFGLAYFTDRILKIDKTAFAFHVLGALFLPIVILSIGFFELAGPYLSISGEGRFLFGAIGSLVVLPIYILLALKLSSRLFVWFSYITLSIFATFLIGSLYLQVDGFYLCIMLFNAALVVGYLFAKRRRRFQQFTTEFVSFIQANLILSTLLMLVFYNNEMIYSVNIFLTAILYLSMIFVTNRREYHFVFSGMIVYAVYQFIDFSGLVGLGNIAFALLGFLFIFVSMVIPKDFKLQKAFRYTSVVISILAFIYITFAGMLIRMNEPSITLLIAYVIMSLQFTFLSTIEKQRIFTYLSPVFLTAALYEATLLLQKLFHFEVLSFALFIASLFNYITFGHLVRWNFFKQVRQSTQHVSSVVMALCIFVGIVFFNWWHVGTMLLTISVLTAFISEDNNERRLSNYIGVSWIHAVTLGLAIAIYYAAIEQNKLIFDYASPLEAKNMVFAGVILLATSFVWKRLKRNTFNENSFFTAQIFYGLGMLFSLSIYFDANLRVLIVVGGVGMAYLLYRRTNWFTMPYVVSAFSLLSYLTMLMAIKLNIDIQAQLYNSLQFVVGAPLLIGTGFIIEKKDLILAKRFWWVGHIYLPIALLVSFVLYEEEAVSAFIISIFIYGVSVLKVKEEWQIKTYLYAMFTSMWAAIYLAMHMLELQEYLHYSFLITSVVTTILWFFSKGKWTQRIAYYSASISTLGVAAFVSVQQSFELGIFVIIIAYIASLLFILHKERWDLLTIIPLLLLYGSLQVYGDGSDFLLLYIALFGVIITAIGYIIYPVIFEEIKAKEKINMDWYAVVGFIALCNLYLLTDLSLWSKLLPGILIFAYLIVQRNRMPIVPEQTKWVVFSAFIYLFQPYYMLLGHFQIPVLFEEKLYFLPWIIPTIFLKRLVDKQQKLLANRIQWGVLLIVSLLVVQDGLINNTIHEAILIGGLSLAALFTGMFYQVKSFFFVGAGVLLLNVFLQTRDYWGNLPWWAYLLTAGSLLIIVASYNEWHKQKTSSGKKTFVTMFKRHIIDKIRKWD